MTVPSGWRRVVAHGAVLIVVGRRSGFFDVNGEWAVEAEGVAPDIELMSEPAAPVRYRRPGGR